MYHYLICYYFKKDFSDTEALWVFLLERYLSLMPLLPFLSLPGVHCDTLSSVYDNP